MAVEFIPAFVDKAIKHHCRKGIRTWCDCSFCSAKKIGTQQIGNWTYLREGVTVNRTEISILIGDASNAVYIQHYPRIDGWEMEHVWRTLIQRRREEQRKVLRQKLLSLQQDVL